MLRTDKRESTDHSFVIDGMTEDFIHDASYAHALVQAIKENDCDGWSGDAWPMQVVLNRAAEIMRGFGYETDT